jgi:hypothetical protein
MLCSSNVKAIGKPMQKESDVAQHVQDRGGNSGVRRGT